MNSLGDILNQKGDILKIKNPEDIEELKDRVYQMKDQLDALLRTLNQKQTEPIKQREPDIEILESGERIVEGVFSGEQMVGSDGKEYSVPYNYASKSKLVEGDLMKLTITKNGSFIYKQIGPIERKRLIGELVSDGEQYSVLADGKTYKVLIASITFFHGKPGDEVVILVPKDGISDWAAVENIINK